MLDVYLRSGDVFLATRVWLPGRPAGPASPSRPGVVFSHGWGGSHVCDDLLAALAARGATVASIEQRGYGRSTGRAELARWPEDMAAAGTWLAARGLTVWAMGLSTGGTMALVTAGRCPWMAGAVALAPFATLARMEADYPPARDDLTARFGPLRPIDYETADAVTAAARIAPRPAVVIHAPGDPTTPFGHGEMIRDQGGARLVAVEGHDHWFETSDRALLVERIAEALGLDRG